MINEAGKSKAKNSSNKASSYIMGIVMGIMIGAAMIMLSNKVEGGILTVIACFVLFIVAFILQLILHESGHLIFGLLSGYEFLSFRVGTLTLVKENGRIVRKKFSISGTAGQCLMMPPEGNGYDCPYVLYNLGGILMNAIVSCLCVAVYALFPMPKMVEAFLLFTAMSGFFDLIMNGVPMKINGICNDGYNIRLIGKDKIARYSFYMAFKVNGLLYQGVRIKDMPFEWFQLPEEADLNNNICCGMKCLEGSYYHDRKEFDKAKECYENILKSTSHPSNVVENEIKCELFFYEIIGEGRKEVIDELYTNELKKYIKATNCYITRKRLMYAYALIIEKDMSKADKILSEVDSVKKTYPSKAEVESELEIIDQIRRKYANNVEN